jgi:hypothetical protein
MPRSSSGPSTLLPTRGPLEACIDVHPRFAQSQDWQIRNDRAHRKAIMLEMLLVASTASPPGIFLNWGIFSIQLGNLIVIIAMFALFAVALVLPFPRGRRGK